MPCTRPVRPKPRLSGLLRVAEHPAIARDFGLYPNCAGNAKRRRSEAVKRVIGGAGAGYGWVRGDVRGWSGGDLEYPHDSRAFLAHRAASLALGHRDVAAPSRDASIRAALAQTTPATRHETAAVLMRVAGSSSLGCRYHNARHLISKRSSRARIHPCGANRSRPDVLRRVASARPLRCSRRRASCQACGPHPCAPMKLPCAGRARRRAGGTEWPGCADAARDSLGNTAPARSAMPA